MGVAIDHFYPVGGPDSQLLMPRITVWVTGKLQSYRVEFDGYEKYDLPSLVPIAMSPVVKLDGRGEEAVAMAYTYFLKWSMGGVSERASETETLRRHRVCNTASVRGRCEHRVRH